MVKHPWKTTSDEIQRAIVEDAIKNASGNITEAASETGLARSHMNYLIDKFELRALAAQLRVQTQGTARGRLTASDRPW